ncbi:MAG TPA: polyketide synthase, partial [Azospirillum sp.]
PAATLAELKAHLARGAGGDAAALLDTAGFVWTGQPPATGAARRVPLASNVVTLDAHPNGVVVVTLCDRASRNTFSLAFVGGVIEAFEHIAATPDYKAVVLTGYETYFACGGTRDGLLAIQSGKARFTDEQSYALPLACEIPVIAAMQGHGIGAGWAMGLFCDWAVYSEESVYQSPYMLYGFTPGAGSTLIFPQRLGPALAREVLFTAREFQGRELKRRGIAMPVLPRAAVPGYALALANHLAASDRQDLVRRKAERSRSLRERLPSVFAQELAMHDRTFVGNADVVANIDRYFNTGIGGAPAAAISAAAPRGAAPSGQTMQSVRESLRKSLAEELLMQPGQLDLDVPFIDLGMDSISAVTWVRKVNSQFGLSLNATRIYSHPDLTRFAELVLSLTGPQVEPPEPAPLEPAADAIEDTGAHGADAGELLAWLRRTLAAELAVGPETLDDDTRFVDLGLDSVTAVTWIRGINTRFGLSIPAPRIYSHPTLAEFHRHLLTLVAGQGADRPA